MTSYAQTFTRTFENLLITYEWSYLKYRYKQINLMQEIKLKVVGL